MTYQETLDYIFDKLPMYQRVGAAAYKADLNNTIALCDAIGNPQAQLRCIHIAGTNGKGSVSHIVAACLQSAGYKTGLYVSPHYKDFRERIKIDGHYISESFVIHFIEKIKPLIESIQPSFFEITVAMAFAYFAEAKIDYAVIETGLGGRLDSTNIITPLLSVITNISYDHMNLLGDTLEKIATEKAGIIKSNIPVLIGEKNEAVDMVFTAKAISEKSDLYFASDLVTINHFVSSLQGSTFDVEMGNGNVMKDINTDLSGAYQLKNVQTALASLQILDNKINGLYEEKNIRAALSNIQERTRFIGRWNMIQRSPLIILDSAHNEAGLKEVLAQLNLLPHEQLHWVYGTVNDKDIEKNLSLLPVVKTQYYFCKPSIPRGLDAQELQQKALTFGLNGSVHNSVNEAFMMAKKNANATDIILVSGSIFVVAEVI